MTCPAKNVASRPIQDGHAAGRFLRIPSHAGGEGIPRTSYMTSMYNQEKVSSGAVTLTGLNGAGPRGGLDPPAGGRGGASERPAPQAGPGVGRAGTSAQRRRAVGVVAKARGRQRAKMGGGGWLTNPPMGSGRPPRTVSRLSTRRPLVGRWTRALRTTRRRCREAASAAMDSSDDHTGPLGKA